jgi:hypothetical protein
VPYRLKKKKQVTYYYHLNDLAQNPGLWSAPPNLLNALETEDLRRQEPLKKVV